MNTFHTPHMTFAEQGIPTLELPVFSDAAAYPAHVAKLGSGAEDLVNMTLAVGAEAAKLQGKGEKAIAAAITTGKFVVDLAVFTNKQGEKSDYTSAPGLFVMRSDAMPDADANWRTLLTLDGDMLEITNHTTNHTTASATFQRDGTGAYSPRQFLYGEQCTTGSYAGIGQTLSVNGVLIYRRLLREEGTQPHQALKTRFKGLALLGTTAHEITERLTTKAGRTTAYVAVESEIFTPMPRWAPVEVPAETIA